MLRKFCSIISVAIIISICSICYADRISVCNFGLDDFMNYYENITKIGYENKKKYDFRFNQKPFKNLSLSNSNYTVYSTTIGKKKDNTVFLNIFINKSGDISYFTVVGDTKKDSQKEFLGQVAYLLSLLCGLTNINDLNNLMEELFIGGTNYNVSSFIEKSNSYLNLNLKFYDAELIKKKYAEIEIFATNDGYE